MNIKNDKELIDNILFETVDVAEKLVNEKYPDHSVVIHEDNSASIFNANGKLALKISPYKLR